MSFQSRTEMYHMACFEKCTTFSQSDLHVSVCMVAIIQQVMQVSAGLAPLVRLVRFQPDHFFHVRVLYSDH